MKLLYGIYGLSMIGLLAISRGETPIANVILWALIALWTTALASLFFGARWFRGLALAALIPVLAVLVFQFGRRIAFIIINGGMEEASSGFGSPVAFLIGWTAESVALIPGLALFIWLWRSGRTRTSES